MIESVYINAFKIGLKPEEKLTVSEWADKNRMLTSRSSAEPGRWRTERTPYLKKIMDCLSSDTSFQDVYMMSGAQVGKTETGLNWIGYVIDHAPAPMIFVQPTQDMAKRASKQRIDPLIETSECLFTKVKDKRSRDSGNTMLQKDFPGGSLILAGANSATGLRSMPARYGFFDEEDAYPFNVDGEGDPVTLAKARGRTFAKRKFFHCSTPTIKGLSRIEKGIDETDYNKFFVPCPDCGHKQHLEFRNLKWDKEDPTIVHYQCDNEECKVLIPESKKTWMLDNGEWRPTQEDKIDPKKIGFHINSLYSPLGWYSWRDIVEDWLDAQDDKDVLRGFVNTVLGETWKDAGEVPDWRRLWERRDLYNFSTVPDGVVFLTAGVDVQKDRLECEVVGWGREKRSWSIDYFVMMGDTTEDAVWAELEELLHKTFYSEDKSRKYQIKVMGVDSGYNTQRVYDWVRTQNATRVFAIKGQDNQTIAISTPKPVDLNWKGKKLRRGLMLWHVGSTHLKSELYGFLRLSKPTEKESYPVGFCHFPQYGEEFFHQMTAEERVIKKIRGYSRPEWVKIRERNEALDCRVYNMAGFYKLGADRFSDEKWEKLAKENQVIDNSKGTREENSRKKKTRRRRESSFW